MGLIAVVFGCMACGAPAPDGGGDGAATDAIDAPMDRGSREASIGGAPSLRHTAAMAVALFGEPEWQGETCARFTSEALTWNGPHGIVAFAYNSYEAMTPGAAGHTITLTPSEYCRTEHGTANTAGAAGLFAQYRLTDDIPLTCSDGTSVVATGQAGGFSGSGGVWQTREDESRAVFGHWGFLEGDVRVFQSFSLRLSADGQIEEVFASDDSGGEIDAVDGLACSVDL